jgi:cytochrome P450
VRQTTDRVDRWRRMRRAANDAFSLKAVERYQPLQTKAAIRTVLDIVSQPQQWKESIEL